MRAEDNSVLKFTKGKIDSAVVAKGNSKIFFENCVINGNVQVQDTAEVHLIRTVVSGRVVSTGEAKIIRQ